MNHIDAAQSALGPELLGKLEQDADATISRMTVWRRLMIEDFKWPAHAADEAIDLAKHGMSQAMDKLTSTSRLGSNEMVQMQALLMGLQLVADACESTIAVMRILDPSIGVSIEEASNG